MKNRKVYPILIPLHYGANYRGIKYGAEYLTKVLDDYILLPELKVEDQITDPHLKNLSSVIATNELLFSVTKTIYQDHNFPLIIGGDHSVALGSISAVANDEDDLGVVWIDAHGDMNTEQTTESGNIHGMILAALLGKGTDSLVNLGEDKIKIKKENVYIFGVRDLDDEEKATIERLHIKYYSYKNIEKVGLEYAVEEVIDYFKGKISKIHLSLDLDAINPNAIPGVSVPVANGFKKEDIKFIIKKFFQRYSISSCDIVEYNPLKDKDNMTLNYIVELVQLIKELV
ncbi:MAG: arginase [Bacilli bacterium]